MATIQETVTLVPSGYTGLTSLTTNSSYPVSNGYEDSSSTDYARFTLNTSTTGYLYYTFDTSSIPSDATIISVSANFKARVGNTTRVTNSTCQLYSGTTAKGSSSAFASTTASVRSITVGSWTRAELTNLRLRIGATGSSSTSTKRFDFYGADVTITYSYTVTSYNVTINNSSSATVTSDKSEAIAGENVTITSSTLSNITVTDNGIDVTSAFVEKQSGSETVIPQSNTNSNFTLSNIDNAYNDATNTTYASLALSGGRTGSIYFDFASLDIPSSANIQNVSCQATLQFSRNGSSSGVTSSFQLYSGSTAKGSANNWVTSATDVAKTTYNLTVGSWTANELANARLYITATNNANSTIRYIYVYGATLSVTYELGSAIYVYTISNISSDHTIVVTQNAQTVSLYFKQNSSWIKATKVYKKVNGSWVEQVDLTTVFQSGVNYIKGGS